MPTIVTRPVRKGPKLEVKSVRELCDRMLAALGLEDAELSVLLVDDSRIHELNRLHREKDRPTDVLAFPLDEAPVEGAPRLLGDIVVSLETALRQARSRKRTLFPEVRFLLAHGLLHLIGFDHGNPRDKRRMDRATRRLVRGVSKKPRVSARSGQHRPAGRPRSRRSAR
ncbi:MAG TPA: rRNA maturation RNase YbeY [Polyangiaceae bacterium]